MFLYAHLLSQVNVFISSCSTHTEKISLKEQKGIATTKYSQPGLPKSKQSATGYHVFISFI
jgi:hypothetical protein